MSRNELPKVLVVDDLPANRHAMLHVLGDLNCEILEARSGEEALEHALRHSLALILLDVQMPGMDGIETASLLSGNSQTTRTPIIFITAFDPGGNATVRGYDVGAVDYLYKPIDPYVLRCKVGVFIELERQRRELDVMAELETSREQLERSNRDLEQFVHTISHDLREPLRSVSAHLQLIQKRLGNELDEDCARWMGYATSGAKRMDAMIRDLLLFSQTGRSPQAESDTDAEQVLATVLMDLSACVQEHEALVVHEPLPRVRAHPSEVAQIFQNLISNAIRYRGDETPRIHVSARRDGERILFSVRDNGRGIEERHFERIFGVFERLGSDGEGTGIGLAVVKRAVERCAGRIWLESVPGVGSEFHFTLPAALPDEADTYGEREAQSA